MTDRDAVTMVAARARREVVIGALAAVRAELECLCEWPQVYVDGALLLYDVALAAGLDEAGCEAALGGAWSRLQRRVGPVAAVTARWPWG